MDMGASTRVSRIIDAPRIVIYGAFVDPDLLVRWRAPENMIGRVHEFDARDGGRYRMSLMYTDDSASGKTSEKMDTFRGRFVKLIPEQEIVEAIEFESSDPRFAGEMTMTTLLRDVEGGCEVTVLCENLPKGIRPEENEEGSRMALEKLARLVAQRDFRLRDAGL
jgi:uncharacterized protein YndB with AHSA1/START domain